MHIFLVKATQLILALAFLIIIHEFGHFLFARMFGVKVEKFYMFFDPLTEIFKWRPKKYIGFFGSHKWLKGATEEEKAAYYDQIKNREKQKENEKFIAEAIEKVRERDLEEAKSKGWVEYQKAKRRKYTAEDVPDLKLPGSSTTSIWEEVTSTDSKGRKKSRFWHNTEYGIGWIPLGGYCKIAGMIDESMDTEQMKSPAKPWEFRSKPAWQRLLIMIAGVLFNFLLAILIYAGIVYATGEKYIPFDRAELGMTYSPAAHKAGFHDGDIPLLADGEKLGEPSEALMRMMQAKEVTVRRDGRDTVITIPEKFMFALQDEMEKGESDIRFLTYRIPTRIIQVLPGEGAARAGLEKGDEILAIDSVTTPSLRDFHDVLESQAEANKALKGKSQATLNFVVRHGASKDAPIDTIPVTLSDGNKMGVGLEVDVTQFYVPEEKRYSLLASIPRGVQMGTEKLTAYAKSMKMVATKEGAKSIGGFGSIGSIFPEKWDWIAFFNIAAFLSVALAFMNILPIPALDGGHVLFLLYEIIFRRPPSQKFMEYAQMCGMIFLLLLLLYANGMDIVRLFK